MELLLKYLVRPSPPRPRPQFSVSCSLRKGSPCLHGGPVTSPSIKVFAATWSDATWCCVMPHQRCVMPRDAKWGMRPDMRRAERCPSVSSAKISARRHHPPNCYSQPRAKLTCAPPKLRPCPSRGRWPSPRPASPTNLRPRCAAAGPRLVPNPPPRAHILPGVQRIAASGRCPGPPAYIVTPAMRVFTSRL